MSDRGWNKQTVKSFVRDAIKLNPQRSPRQVQLNLATGAVNRRRGAQ
jgi:hypothetical protein